MMNRQDALYWGEGMCLIDVLIRHRLRLHLLLQALQEGDPHEQVAARVRDFINDLECRSLASARSRGALPIDSTAEQDHIASVAPLRPE